jgi:putative glutamine amidotransferase
MSSTRKAIVLVPACNRTLDEHVCHIAGKKYVDAVWLAGCQPLIVPSVPSADIDELLDIAHGVLLTGSPSNVHPSNFGEHVHDPSLPLDPARDEWTLPLIPRALERGMPLFAICRGAQEVNVALGGTLHQAVQDVGPYADHRSRDEDALELQYGDTHPVQVTPGGLLERLTGRREFAVNSLHGQAVNQLAPSLRVEARAPDGLVEAFTQAGAPGFNLCVQWHPEWRAAGNPVSMALLQAFGAACRSYRERPRGPLP